MYQRILVPLDGSETSLRGLDEAIGLARLNGARLRLVHIVNELKYISGFELYSTDLVPLMREAGEQILTDGKKKVTDAGLQVDSVLSVALTTRVSDLVVEQAKSWHADLIVIGTHGRHGLRRVLLGSDAEQLLRIAPVPVLLVRHSQADAAAAVPVHETSRTAVAPGMLAFQAIAEA